MEKNPNCLPELFKDFVHAVLYILSSFAKL